MLRKLMFAVGLGATLAITLPLRAQNGCVDSPEDPTLVLALVGGAGALAVGRWNSRLRKR
ncbi:MAG: PExPT-CTERM protein [Terracidiphilus sp.]|jgi:XrtJ-associated TM-motif-TM protein